MRFLKRIVVGLTVVVLALGIAFWFFPFFDISNPRADQATMNWGMDPGLGVRELHQDGYTGKGVVVGYIDQPLLLTHEAYRNIEITYDVVWPEEQEQSSMHGPAVVSLLAGREIGVAPDIALTYVAEPSWLMDHQTRVDALHKLIHLNETLPPEKRVRVVGISNSTDARARHSQEFKAAIQQAEAAGIMVFYVDMPDLTIEPITILPMSDKRKPENYDVAPLVQGHAPSGDYLWVPTSGRTTASGLPAWDRNYRYWTNGGVSWAVPYVVGTVALGLQVDPSLTHAETVQYLKQTGYPFRGGRIINPRGFVEMVKQSKGE